MWMAGYAARTKPSEGAVHDLWAKALALEDPAGQRAILITLDICGIDRELSNRVRDTLKSRHGLDRDRIVLACSHTHSGPVVGTNLLTMYKIDADQHGGSPIMRNSWWGPSSPRAGQAIDRLEESQLAWGTGRCDFAVNRRANKEAEVPELRRQLALQGPVDHDVPVLKVTGAQRRACSRSSSVTPAIARSSISTSSVATTLALPRSTSRKRHPGAQAMFVAGCGGDQNPIPRRALDLAVGYGKQLADSVEEALRGPLKTIDGPIATGYEEIALAFAASADQRADRARHQVEQFLHRQPGQAPPPDDRRGRAGSSRRILIPVEVWRLGGLTWVFLGGEVVVDYSLRIKRNLGSSHTWVSAYCNDVMAYIPSRRVLKEGGYEGGGAMVYYGQPAVWSDEVEEAIIAAVARRLQAAGL